MIITKGMDKISGYIEYSYRFKFTQFMGITEDDEDSMFESDTFSSLEELLEKIQPNVLEEIKNDYEADEVWVSCISFKGISEDGETASDISMFDNGRSRGFISTEVKNEDITNRALLNMKKIKEIVDNTIDQYPIKY